MADQETDPEDTDTEQDEQEQGLLARIKGVFSRN